MSKDLGGIVFNDYSDEVLDAMQDAVARALERIGMQAEGYAKDLTPVDTGNLRNSITYDIDKDERKVYIGTNVEYAPYVELGTGKYAAEGGRPTPWMCLMRLPPVKATNTTSAKRWSPAPVKTASRN